MKTKSTLLIGLALSGLLVSSAAANLQVEVDLGDPNQFGVPNYGTTEGGELTIVALTDLTPTYKQGSWFKTFCLEKGEYLEHGATYYAEISDRAVFGGINHTNPPPYTSSDPFDLLDPRTAYLFSKYAPQVDSDTKANDLQNAIWYIEGETGWNSLSATAKDYVTEADFAVTNGDWVGLGNVRVLQLWTDPTIRTWDTRAQDVLILVPAPGAALLAFLGLATAGWLKRRIA
ncbi:MAG TPA: hypothetical protein PLQ89_19185 [Phycisphaerae bacterium]|nr:hypothetical protein [Phycisphaerae bacterium]HOQ87836.1 hypothetical protein [Phycisphaerae bacterium]